ncbi:hypothetical protein [Teredinibacter turnerae]|uniref:hypothetical protein n=1 Tax=Teredinibacter turnerae TaxID=2426 RepID=UPI0012FCA7F1|nr:hypothetical protein [Teredinibacter turnerae]
MQYGTVWAVFTNVRPVEVPGDTYGPNGLMRNLCMYDTVEFTQVRLGIVSERNTPSDVRELVSMNGVYVRRAIYRSENKENMNSLEYSAAHFDTSNELGRFLSLEAKGKGEPSCDRIVLSRSVSPEEVNDAIYSRDSSHEFQNVRYSNVKDVCIADKVKREIDNEQKHESEYLKFGQILGDIEGTIKLASGIGVALEPGTIDNNKFSEVCASASASRRRMGGREIKARLKKGMRVRLTSVRVEESQRCDFANLIILPPTQADRAKGKELGNIIGRAISFSDYGYYVQESKWYKSVPSITDVKFSEYDKLCKLVVFPMDGMPIKKGIGEWRSVTAKNVVHIDGRCYAENFQFEEPDRSIDPYQLPAGIKDAIAPKVVTATKANRVLPEKSKETSGRASVPMAAEGFISNYRPFSLKTRNLLVLNPYIQEPTDSEGNLISCESFQYSPVNDSAGITVERLEAYAYWYELFSQRIPVRVLGVKAATNNSSRCVFSEAVAIDDDGNKLPMPNTVFDRSEIERLKISKWYGDCLQSASASSSGNKDIGIREFCTCKTIKISEDAVKTVGRPLPNIRSSSDYSKLFNLATYYCQNPDHYKKPELGAIKRAVPLVNTQPEQRESAVKIPASTKINSGEKAFSLTEFGHFRVVPVDSNSPIAPEVKAMWAKGFYVHLKPDGNFGFNTDQPGPYLYLPVNRWENKNGVFTLTLDTVVYAFTLPTKESDGETILKAIDSTWSAFEMTYVTKEKGVR